MTTNGERPRDLDQPEMEAEIARLTRNRMHAPGETPKRERSFRTEPNTDPGLTAEQHALARARRLVDDMRGGSLQHLTQLRDNIDDLMRAITAKSDKVESEIAELANMVQSSVKMVGEIAPLVNEQQKRIAASLDPAPGKTVTAS